MKKIARRLLVLQIGKLMVCLLPLLCLACLYFDTEVLNKVLVLYSVLCVGFYIFFLTCRKQSRHLALPPLVVLSSIIFCAIFLSKLFLSENCPRFLINTTTDILDYPISCCFKFTLCIVIAFASLSRYARTKDCLLLCLLGPTLMFLLLFVLNDTITLLFCTLSCLLSALSIAGAHKIKRKFG